jgi:hypothetical protein
LRALLIAVGGMRGEAHAAPVGHHHGNDHEIEFPAVVFRILGVARLSQLRRPVA